uniref:Ripply transcriptional repressor 2 n=1 Tax=Salvator merianae TaxID=96440 RepID=A0A8D0DVK2_SALMN
QPGCHPPLPKDPAASLYPPDAPTTSHHPLMPPTTVATSCLPPPPSPLLQAVPAPPNAPTASCHSSNVPSFLLPPPQAPLSPLLFWPKSRCFDYLYHEAEALLRNFPVQATISFYEDSENEEDNDDFDHESEELDSEVA